VSTTPATTEKRLLTVEEFAALPGPIDGSKQELVRGEVVTMPPPGFFHGIVQGTVYFLLRIYADRTKSGRVTVESGVVTETGPASVRGPDVAFWSFARLPAEDVPVVYANVAADLVAEVVSPSNTRKHLAQKVREYFATGVRVVWVVDPDERTVTVYHKPGDGKVLWEDATLTGDDVLPGFSCSVAALFA
jgi:Uma2 family endonuclease